MKVNIPIEVVFDDLNSMIDELGKLQKYKFGEGDDMTLVDVCDVADILARHVKAREAKRGTHWIPCSERLPEHNQKILAYYADIDRIMLISFNAYGITTMTAWMPLPKPYGGETDV